jgi:hypothetical protein
VWLRPKRAHILPQNNGQYHYDRGEKDRRGRLDMPLNKSVVLFLFLIGQSFLFSFTGHYDLNTKKGGNLTYMRDTENIIYDGVPAHYNFFPGDDKYISHGEFRLTNHSDGPVEIQFYRCELIIDSNAKNIDTFYVYVGDDLIRGNMTVSANSVTQIKITFPFISVRDLRFQKIGVRSQVTCDSKQYSATSEINVTFEKGASN